MHYQFHIAASYCLTTKSLDVVAVAVAAAVGREQQLQLLHQTP